MSDTNGSGDAEEISTYQTSVFQRRLSFLSVAALLLLASMEATNGGPVLELLLMNVMLTGGMLLATARYRQLWASGDRTGIGDRNPKRAAPLKRQCSPL